MQKLNLRQLVSEKPVLGGRVLIFLVLKNEKTGNSLGCLHEARLPAPWHTGALPVGKFGDKSGNSGQAPGLSPGRINLNFMSKLDDQKFSVNVLYLLTISGILNVRIIISFNSLISLSLPLTFNL
ncbi:MAG: hypothetical protein ACOCV7_06425 [Desulfonatronovibrionaceae bacterium]